MPISEESVIKPHEIIENCKNLGTRAVPQTIDTALQEHLERLQIITLFKNEYLFIGDADTIDEDRILNYSEGIDNELKTKLLECYIEDVAEFKVNHHANHWEYETDEHSYFLEKKLHKSIEDAIEENIEVVTMDVTETSGKPTKKRNLEGETVLPEAKHRKLSESGETELFNRAALIIGELIRRDKLPITSGFFELQNALNLPDKTLHYLKNRLTSNKEMWQSLLSGPLRDLAGGGDLEAKKQCLSKLFELTEVTLFARPELRDDSTPAKQQTTSQQLAKTDATPPITPKNFQFR